MAKLYASSYYTPSESKKSRQQVTLTEASTVEGDAVTWVVDTAEDHVTLAKWSNNRQGEYIDAERPLIVVKHEADSSSNNTLVKSEDGTTIFTFDTDDSAAPVYAAFRLVTGSKNTASWRVA